jgi:hypothetical protein
VDDGCLHAEPGESAITLTTKILRPGHGHRDCIEHPSIRGVDDRVGQPTTLCSRTRTRPTRRFTTQTSISGSLIDANERNQTRPYARDEWAEYEALVVRHSCIISDANVLIAPKMAASCRAPVTNTHCPTGARSARPVEIETAPSETPECPQTTPEAASPKHCRDSRRRLRNLVQARCWTHGSARACEPLSWPIAIGSVYGSWGTCTAMEATVSNPRRS